MMKFCRFVFRINIIRGLNNDSISHNQLKSISNDGIPINSRRNPFNKVCNKPQIEDVSRSAERLSITVLGNGAMGQPRGLCIFTERKCYMFNCGEGVMRLMKEHGIQCPNVKHVFITEKSWKNLSGLSDIYVTQSLFGLKKLTVHGPPNIERFLDVNTSTVKRSRISMKTFEDSPFCDDELEIQYIPFHKRQMKNFRSKNLSHNFTKNPPCDADLLVSYICKVKPRPGNFSPEKCIEHGVSLGPLLLQLKNGEDITLSSGKLVCSKDVHENHVPGVEFLVIDCPYETMVDDFINEDRFKPYRNKGLFAVFHFSPPHVVNSYKYTTWMHNFNASTRHIMLNSDNSTASSEAVHELQQILHTIHPDIFPLLHEKQSHPGSYPGKNYISAETSLQFYIRPEFIEDRTNVTKITPEKYMERALGIPNFESNLKALHEEIFRKEKELKGKSIQKYPEVVFLGTSSATSSAYRNVSAILVHVNEDNSILLDCGEGTYTQLLRFYGYEKITSVLQRISCVFISHQHLDHYSGFFQLCQARKEAFTSSMRNYVPLSVVTNCFVSSLIKKFHRHLEPILYDIRLFSSSDLVENSTKSDNINSCFKNVELQTVPVVHCTESYGAVLKGSNWKVVYSGDCIPSQSLVDAGQNCDLLIHEASVEDGLINEAAFRHHSTPAQVIDVAEKMNAQHTIMTHFSKRYLVAPFFPESKNVGCAFDNMKVQLHHLPLLPLFIPTLKALFSTLLEQHKERSDATVSFEKVFMKNTQQHM